MRQGKVDAANREYDLTHHLVKEGFRNLPDRGEAALKRILSSAQDRELKVSAAAYLLAIDQPVAMMALEELAAAGSMDAKYTLIEWRKGKLFDYLNLTLAPGEQGIRTLLSSQEVSRSLLQEL